MVRCGSQFVIDCLDKDIEQSRKIHKVKGRGVLLVLLQKSFVTETKLLLKNIVL